MEKALDLAPGDAGLMFQAGVVHELWFKEREQALEWLGRALAAGYQLSEVERSPALAGLRKDGHLKELQPHAKARLPAIERNRDGAHDRKF